MPPEATRDIIGLRVLLTRRALSPGWDVTALEGDERGRLVAHVSRAELTNAVFLTPKRRRITPWRSTRRPGVAGEMAAFDDQVDYPRGYRVSWPRCTELPRIRGTVLRGSRRLILHDRFVWACDGLDVAAHRPIKVRMNPKTRFNPSFGRVHVRPMKIATGRSYWSSVPNDLSPDDLRHDLEPLTCEFMVIPDFTAAVMAAALKRKPWERRDAFVMVDYARMDPEEIYPSSRDGTIHAWARRHIAFLENYAVSLDMSPHQLPMSYDEACDMNLEIDAIAWPWLQDHKTLDALEKSVRMMAYEAHHVAAQCGAIEKDVVTANSRAFLGTGLSITDTYRIQPGTHPLTDRLLDCCEKLQSIDFDFLRDMGVLPMTTMWEDSDWPYYTDGEEHFFEDTDGWKGHELTELLGLRDHCSWKFRVGDDPWDGWYRNPEPRFRDMAEQLARFVNSVKERQNQFQHA